MASPTSDYVQYFLNLETFAPESIFTVFFLGLFRIAPIVGLAPFLGSKLPNGVKVGLSISLTFIFIPELLDTSKQVFAFNMEFVAYGLKEILMGIILGFLSTIPFYIAQGAGSLIDFLRGSSSLMVRDPTMGQGAQTSAIGSMFNYILIVVFFQIGGPIIFLNTLFESFQILPIDKMIPISFFNLSLPFWKTIIGLMTRILAISIQLAAPSIVSILMAEMFLGIANRLAPRVQIVFLGMSLKSLLGLGMLWAAWFFILKQMSHQSLLWIQNIDEILRSFQM